MKYSLLLCAAFFFFLSGCGNNSNTTKVLKDTTPPQTTSSSTENVLQGENTTSDTVVLEQTAGSSELTQDDLNQNSEYLTIRAALLKNGNDAYDMPVYTYSQNDCFGVENGLIYTEDLLSLLGDNTKAPQILKPKIYTKEYIATLKKRIETYSTDNHKSMPAIFYMCHLEKDLDILSGKYFFDKIEKDSEVDTTHENTREHKMFLISKGVLFALDNIQMLDTTGTGGEVFPCHGKLSDNKIFWSCFTGIGMDEEKNSTFSTYRDWTISLDGRILSLKDRKN